MDFLKTGNSGNVSSLNQLSPHYPLSKAKSSQNINRQSSIKSEKKQQKVKQSDLNLKDQQVQTDLTMMSILFQTEKHCNSLQENEQIDNQQLQQQRSNIDYKQYLQFQFCWNHGIRKLYSQCYLILIYNSPVQSTTNSNLPSPRNQQSCHQTNVFPSPSSSIHKTKMQSLKLEQEQNSTQIQNSQFKEQRNIQRRKSLKQKIYDLQEEKHLNQQHRRMYTTIATQSQTTSPREYYTPRNKTKDDLVLNKLQQEQEEKEEEEKLFYDQMINETPEQNEQEIIQKAINRTPGYELGQEVDDKIMETMFGNLNKAPDIVEMIIQQMSSKDL